MLINIQMSRAEIKEKILKLPQEHFKGSCKAFDLWECFKYHIKRYGPYTATEVTNMRYEKHKR